MRIKRKEKRLPAVLGPQVGLVFLTPPTKIYNNITYIVFTHFSAYKMKLLFCFYPHMHICGALKRYILILFHDKKVNTEWILLNIKVS